ncbi:carbon-nitrogen hydrolase family protein [Rhodoferax saidenbachensis]|uniref:Amidohydrolase n=1 Tax=Rhodoferax saidenbachensis TaxID=1484693 RepID=A0ABU1ZID0_9BURK|nr:carbon-nitrogen hydrolase family protein [Rhodoferax saidenbachensis]MDR7305293.1 putative amidohydrolase [Rhodoferax saidenbachensis]
MNIAQAATKDIAITIAAAQSTSVPLDVAANVQEHLRFVEAAADHGVQWLVFPELSLTGYELAAMPSLVLHAEHALLAPLREAARRTGMAITVGAPVDSGNALPAIGAITLRPDGQHSVYRKFHLHDGEKQFAAPGLEAVHLQNVGAASIASAICADTNFPSHAAGAAQAGANVYVAGILTSENGYAAEAPLWASYARDHRMVVLIANHGGPSGGYVSAGKSGIWDAEGTLITQAPGTEDWLLVANAI